MSGPPDLAEDIDAFHQQLADAQACLVAGAARSRSTRLPLHRVTQRADAGDLDLDDVAVLEVR